MHKDMQTVQRFSIRKCVMGAGSVLLGVFLVSGSALAEEVSTVSDMASQQEALESSRDVEVLEKAIEKTVAESLKNTKVNHPSKEVIDVASSETTDQKVEKNIVTEPKVTVPEAKKETPQAVAPRKEVIPQKVVESVVEGPKKKTSNASPTLNFSHLGDDYPAYLKNAAPDSIIDSWRLWNRECVSFVAHRLSTVNGFIIPSAYGNADQWGTRAQNEGYVVNKIPAVGSVAWWRGCHVAWVSAVSGNFVTIEEYNYGYNHKYNKRTISINEVDGFIHFKDVSDSNVATRVTAVSPVSHSGLARSGTYQFTKKSIIRAEAKQSSPELAHYEAGQSVHYDRLVEADGFKWLSYLSYNGNRRYIAIEALTSSIKGSLKIQNQNNTKGTFDVVVSNIQFNGHLKEVLVPIWSENAGQDDIIWYKAIKQSDNTYKVTVNVAKHKHDRGTYHAHLYYQEQNGNKTYVTKTTATLSSSKTTSKITLPKQGVYTFKKSSPVKGEAKSSSETLATYGKGQTVNYDKVLIAEGKQWISYIGFSGLRRYVPIS